EEGATYSWEVSIHILPEGRMKGSYSVVLRSTDGVSIHILPEGRMKAKIEVGIFRRVACFNPHPSRRKDERNSLSTTTVRPSSFNPHPSRRKDERSQRLRYVRPIWFQSTS